MLGWVLRPSRRLFVYLFCERERKGLLGVDVGLGVCLCSKIWPGLLFNQISIEWVVI